MEIMETSGSPPSEPLLSVRKAMLVLLVNGLFMSVVDRLARDLGIETNRFWYVLVRAYFVGHALLVFTLAARVGLPMRFPIDRSFMDALVVIGAPWVGPFLWYREWKKVNQDIQK